MISPRWRKLLRDVRLARGRMIMMLLAIAVGIIGVGTILSAYSILTREIGRNYAGTNPASAWIELDRANEKLASAARARPGIADAEAGATMLARVEIRPNEWMPLMLFVVSDFRDLRINAFKPESGDWPPPAGSILLERTALPLTGANVGDSLNVQAPNGSRQTLAISGLVHDPGLAPAWQEQTIYGYATPETLVRLGEEGSEAVLKVIVKDHPEQPSEIERQVSDLAAWLKQQGYTVGEIRIPPPGKHPHQSQMSAILLLLMLFSFMALTLSAILTATLIGGLLAQQVRQIGVMKAVGAQTKQIAGLYMVWIAAVSAFALLLGVWPSIAAGRGFARAVASLLNLTLFSEAIPGWVYAIQAAAGILVPFLAALVPIVRATRVTVRDAINDFGTGRKTFGASRLDAWLGRMRGLDRTLLLAFRNTFRRRGRLLLTLGLLAAAGAMFITSLNVKQAWMQNLADGAANRHFDLEIRLRQPENAERLTSLLSSVAGVEKAESWNIAPAGVGRSDGLEIVKTYPDGGHGSFAFRELPAGTAMVRFPILSGKRLEPGDAGGVMLNQNARALFPDDEVGDTIPLNVDGKLVRLRLIGVVKEVLSPAAAYVTPDTFALAAGRPGTTNALRIAMSGHDQATRDQAAVGIERALELQGIHPKIDISESALDEAINGHVYIFIFALMFMAVLMATVGGLGLMATMGTNIVERTREFGIMRTIGGKSGTIVRNVIAEGLLIGFMSGIIAVALSLPLSYAIGDLVGNLSFRTPLPLVLSPAAVIGWLIIITLGSAAASAYPARKASQLTIRETLAHI